MLKLIKSPDPVLLQKAVDWDFQTDTDAVSLEKEMVELMTESGGIGLAANQVGILKRVFAIKLKDNPTPFAMFNPTVINASTQEMAHEEGCLSFPDLWLDVKRPVSIDTKYIDSAGKECTITLTGIDARCFLHELDHLDGKVFTQLVSPMKLMLAKKKQIKKRKRNG